MSNSSGHLPGLVPSTALQRKQNSSLTAGSCSAAGDQERETSMESAEYVRMSCPGPTSTPPLYAQCRKLPKLQGESSLGILRGSD